LKLQNKFNIEIDLLTVGSGIPYRAVENFQKIFHRPFSGRKSRWTFGWRTRV